RSRSYDLRYRERRDAGGLLVLLRRRDRASLRRHGRRRSWRDRSDGPVRAFGNRMFSRRPDRHTRAKPRRSFNSGHFHTGARMKTRQTTLSALLSATVLTTVITTGNMAPALA